MKHAGAALFLSLVTFAACGGDDTGSSDFGDSGGADSGSVSDTSADSTSSGSSSDSGESGDAGESGSDDSASPADGEMLYLQVCSSCHGMNAEGTDRGYELRHPVREFAEFVVRNGREGPEFPDSVMIAYSDAVLPDASLELVFDYLDTFPQPTTGEDLYVDYCGNCHGADAAGGSVDKSIRGETDEILEKVREGANTDDVGDRNSYMPAYNDSALSDAEIDLIGQYVDNL